MSRSTRIARSAHVATLAAALALGAGAPAAAAAGDTKHDYPVVAAHVGDTKDDLRVATVARPAGDTKDDLHGTTVVTAGGDTKHDLAVSVPAPKVGDTPSEFGRDATPRAGDTPSEFGRPVSVPSPAATRDDRSGDVLLAVLAAILVAGTLLGAVRVAGQRRRRGALAAR